nr:ribonuclease H-like domain, reverse transcriptase, RNA-dependent DNA polymerase [Tanacetum cinerariifolium]
MDLKSDFLYEKIEEDVYICQPLGFEDPDFSDNVYKVEKALYGLHQAPRTWPDIMFAVCACARYQVNLKVSYLHECKKKTVVANSTTQAEYVAASSDGPRCQDTMRDTSAHSRVISSSDDEALDKEDTSKQERIIDDLDADNDITLVKDQEMFDVIRIYKVKKWLLNKRLLKSQLLMLHRGIVIKDHKETSESRTTTITISLRKSQDKGKDKMSKEPVKLKKKEQILFDEEVARKLQEEIYKKE